MDPTPVPQLRTQEAEKSGQGPGVVRAANDLGLPGFLGVVETWYIYTMLCGRKYIVYGIWYMVF